MSFIDEQDRRYAPLWSRIREHPFLLETRDGTLDPETFATWMRQDYLFVEAAIPFIGALLPKAPVEHWAPLSGVIGALEKELHLFEERAARVGVELRGAPPAFACHAYVQFLLSTAAHASYPVAWTVLYAAERAYHDSWVVVRDGIDPDSPWTPFVENWAGGEFASYVGWLGGELETLAREASPGERERMSEAYRLTLLYELAFWEMAHGAEGWPGTDDDLARTAGGPRWNPDPEAATEGAWSNLADHARKATGEVDHD
ncbi:MAG: TenA family transcriptional regulator [Gemmatimonadales bacterium]|nr:MAG: TenA family transcriptional regulator [Gemmatimonadales bacterium]